MYNNKVDNLIFALVKHFLLCVGGSVNCSIQPNVFCKKEKIVNYFVDSQALKMKSILPIQLKQSIFAYIKILHKLIF